MTTMRLHTNTITRYDILQAARAAGRDVRATVAPHGSRSRARALHRWADLIRAAGRDC